MKFKSPFRIASLLSAVLITAAFTASASARPEPTLFYPVKSMKEANKLKTGSQIAFACGNCRGITITTVDAEHSHMKGFTCPLCKKAFTVVDTAGGLAGSSSGFTYTTGGRSGGTSFIAAVR